MLLAQCDDMVDALATDCSDQPLGKTVLPRRARYTSLIGGSAGLISNDRVPDHSTFSVNRYGRFRDSNILILPMRLRQWCGPAWTLVWSRRGLRR